MYGCFTALNGKLYINAAYINAGTLSSDYTFTGKLVAENADITGSVYATAGELENLTITGKLYFGGDTQYYINANYNDGSYYINLPGLRVDDASGAVFSGKLSAATGTFSGDISAASGTFKGSIKITGTNTNYFVDIEDGIMTVAGSGIFVQETVRDFPLITFKAWDYYYALCARCSFDEHPDGSYDWIPYQLVFRQSDYSEL